LLNRHRRCHRVGRARERRHDPVPEVVVERALVRGDRLTEQAMMLASRHLRALLPELRPQRRRAHEIREENRQGTAARSGGRRRHLPRVSTGSCFPGANAGYDEPASERSGFAAQLRVTSTVTL
jgi:hypothetical protein